jgi:hypothetical protein
LPLQGRLIAPQGAALDTVQVRNSSRHTAILDRIAVADVRDRAGRQVSRRVKLRWFGPNP